MNKRNNNTVLSRQVFIYLVAIAFISVLSVGAFWLEGRLARYNREIRQLKETFSETKKLEIKNKILEIKDYLLWIQYSRNKPIAHSLATQTESLVLPTIISGAGSEPLTHLLPQAYKDSISNSRVPVYIFDSKGTLVYSFNPFSGEENASFSPGERELIEKIKGKSGSSGTLSLYHKSGSNDSLLVAAGYFNRMMIPGFRVVSMVGPEHLEEVLKIHLLDSISKIRFAENEYVFVNTMDGKALVTHGRYNNPPRDILASGDTAWIAIFRVQQSSAANPPGVFHTYRWALLSSTKTSAKTAYFSYIPTWQWVIGMGFYEDDVNSVISLRRKELIEDMWKTVRSVMIYLLISIALCFFLVRYFSGKLGRNITLFNKFFERAAKEHILIDQSEVTYREFAFMAEAANMMVEERKEIEEALRESESHYRYLFEQNPVPLFIYENNDLKIVSVNEAFVDHYGYTMEEVLGKEITFLFREDEREAFTHLIRKLKGLACEGEWHHLKKDGTQIIVEVSSHGFLKEGHPTRIAAVNDITTRKRAEEEIRMLNASLERKVEDRTSMLESANKELEAFSYSVSHDLRAPLRHINGFLELFSRHASDQLDEKGRHYIMSISSASNRMGLLIDSLLNFSRTGRMEMKMDNFDMNTIVSEALSFLEPETDGREIRWTLHPMPRVHADSEMIRQVWINLLSNAIKYTRNRESAEIEIGAINEDKEDVFFIRDNGTGFDMNYSQKLFGVFQRLHTHNEFEGTGIGLANVRQVINRHRGRTWAVGEMNSGATFYFSLPRN